MLLYDRSRRIWAFVILHGGYALGVLGLTRWEFLSLAHMLVILPPVLMALRLGIRYGLASYGVSMTIMGTFSVLQGTTGYLWQSSTLFGSLTLFAIVVTLGHLRDVSDNLKQEMTTHKRTRRALERSEEKYRNVVERASDGIVIVTESIVHFANPKMADMLGYDLGDIMGRGFLNFVFPSHRKRISKLFASLDGLEPSEAFYDLLLRHRDGSEVKTEFSIGKVPLREGTSILLIVRDVSLRMRIQAEKETLEEQLRRTQKLESLGRLAGGVAHDMNNILSGILNSATLLSSIELAEENRADVENIIVAAKRGGALTRDLLGFARKGQYQKRTISINDVVHATLSLLVKTIPKNIEIVSRLDLGVTWIEGDPDQLSHALMNVLLNSVDALSGKRGAIRVRTVVVDEVTKKRDKIAGNPSLKGFARVEISDDGCGMSRAVLVNAFEPFFTTKATGEGAGLGLSMVYGTVQKHGGTVEISSTEGKGTTVSLTFPLAEAADRPSADASLGRISTDSQARLNDGFGVSFDSSYSQGCVLVVDDEASIRISTKRFLKSQGYDVLLAETGQKALQIIEKEGSRVQVVLLDMIMPVMDGYDTFYELRNLDVDAEVILISGFCADEKVEQMVRDGAFGFVQKPVDPHVLSYELYRAYQLQQSKKNAQPVN